MVRFRSGAAVPLVAALFLTVLAGCGGSSSPSEPSAGQPDTGPEPVVQPSLPEPTTQGVVARVRTGDKPCAAIEAAGGLWVTNFGDDTVVKIDPARNRVVARYETASQPCGVAFAAGSLWIGSVGGQVLQQLDPNTGEIKAEIPAGGQIYDVQAGFDSVWLDNYQSNEVLRVDPVRAEVVHRHVVGNTIYGLAVTPEGVWTAPPSARPKLPVSTTASARAVNRSRQSRIASS